MQWGSVDYGPVVLLRERKPGLLDQLREALRSRHYSRRTEQTYCQWVKRFIYFHNVRHPKDMAEPEINAFLTHLAVKDKIAASTQDQALSALPLVCRHVLGREIGDLGEVIRARKPKRLPVVMTRDEVKAVLANLTGEKPLSPNAPRAIPSGIPLRRIFWKGATTFGQSRSSSATRT